MGSNTPITNQPTAPKPRFDYGVKKPPAVQAVHGAAALRVDTGLNNWAMGVLALVFAGVFYYLYSSNLKALVSLWYGDPGWSHGFLVPVLSAYLIYLRWEEIRALRVKGSWAGLAVLAVGVIGQVLFAATGQTHMQNLSMIVVLFGVVIWVLGIDYQRILWLPIAYLVFSINPPGELYQRLTAPMQMIAANLSCKMLTVINFYSEVHGNQVAVLWNGKFKEVNVAEACSGMKTLLSFFALAVALAYTSHRPTWQRVFLTLCAIPVAIICNALRVAVIGVLIAQDPRDNSPWAHGAAHGYIGLLMLIPAMGMQLAIAWVMDRIFVEHDTPAPAAPGGAA